MTRLPLDDAVSEDAALRHRCLMGDGQACRFAPPVAGLDRSGLVGEVRVVRCETCGTGFTRPAIADVAFLYADRSSQDFQQGGSGLTHAIKHFVFGIQARRLLAQAGAAPRLVVDFACGSGLFTRRLADALGPAARVVGSDFHDQPPPDLGGLEYRSLANIDDLAGQADLVMAMHVLEHDDDPKALLARIVALVRPGGVLVLEVPNVDCAWTSVFGRNWDAWYLPYHRTHFTRASLAAVVEQAGLTIERRVDISLPTVGRTLALLTGMKNGVVFVLLGAALHPLQWLGEVVTGRPAALRLIARKPA